MVYFFKICIQRGNACECLKVLSRRHILSVALAKKWVNKLETGLWKSDSRRMAACLWLVKVETPKRSRASCIVCTSMKCIWVSRVCGCGQDALKTERTSRRLQRHRTTYRGNSKLLNDCGGDNSCDLTQENVLKEFYAFFLIRDIIARGLNLFTSRRQK